MRRGADDNGVAIRRALPPHLQLVRIPGGLCRLRGEPPDGDRTIRDAPPEPDLRNVFDPETGKPAREGM